MLASSYHWNEHGLTVRQQDVLEFIRRRGEIKGYMPTLREIQAFMGSQSCNAALDVICRLERKGFIRREANPKSLRNRSRNITLTEKGVAATPVRPRVFVAPTVCVCGATYFGARCPACAGVFQGVKAS